MSVTQLDAGQRLVSYAELTEAATALLAAPGPREPFALLVGDLDHFRRVAAAIGDGAAARLVDDVAQMVAALLRGGDLVSVTGGDEVVALVRCGAQAGRDVAERLVAAIRGHVFTAGDSGAPQQVTMSVGVAAAPEHGTTWTALHAAADAARLRLKAQGRDGAALAPLAHHEPLHRPLDIARFAGRRDELRALTAALDDAVAGQPRVVGIVGERGSGTATLVRQLEPEVRLRGGSLVGGRAAEPAASDPFSVWTGVLRALARLQGQDGRTWRELHRLSEHLPPATDAGAPTGSRYRLLEEFSELLREASAARPLVILLDDMQWADAASWEALEHVVAAFDRERVLICLAFRSDPAFVEAAERRAALARDSRYRELSLSRLTRDEVKRWLEGAFHNQEIGREFLAFLYRHTEGNPLFIAELLRTLVEEGALWHSGERWEWSPVSELRLPAGLPALIRRRLARFSASAAAVLGTAAVFGRDFEVSLLVAAGAGSEAAVRLALAEALAAGMIRTSYERRAGGFSFAHDSVVEVLVATLPPDRLPALHERVARALSRHRGASDAAVAAHFDRAGVAPSAYKAALRAATLAEGLHAHPAAAAQLQVAARNATSPAELAEVRVRLATLAEVAGRFDEAEELCDLAIEWFDGQGDRLRALTLRRMRERARKELGQPARTSLDALMALDAEASELGVERERVAILIMLSQTHQRLGDSAAAERIAEEAVGIAERLGDANLLAEALNRLAVVVNHASRARARAIYTRALALTEATGDVRGQARCHINIGAIALHGSDWDEARDAYGRAIALARAAGMPDYWGIAASNLGVIAHRLGDYSRARDLFGEGLALFAAVKNSELQLYALYNMAHIEWESGAYESAAELYEATASLATRIGADDVEIGAGAGEGLCLYELGRVEAATRACAAVEARLAGRTGWFQGREFPEALAIRVAVGEGRLDEAVARFERAVPQAEEVDLYSAAWLTAVCARFLAGGAAEAVLPWVRRYVDRVRALGYEDMTRQLMRASY